MTDENQENTQTRNPIADAKSVIYGAVAAMYAQERNVGGADLALRKLPYDKSDPVQKGFVKGALASDRSVLDTAKGFGSIYRETIGKVGVASLPEVYSDAFNYATPENMQKIISRFKEEKYKGKTVKDIEKDLTEANNVLRTPHLYTEEEIEEASNTIESHKRYAEAEAALENISMFEAKGAVDKELHKKSLEELARNS